MWSLTSQSLLRLTWFPFYRWENSKLLTVTKLVKWQAGMEPKQSLLPKLKLFCCHTMTSVQPCSEGAIVGIPQVPTRLPHPSPPHSELQVATKHWFSVSCVTQLPLAIYFTHGNIYVSMLFSQIIPPSPSPTVFKSLFFTSVSPLLPCM